MDEPALDLVSRSRAAPLTSTETTHLERLLTEHLAVQSVSFFGEPRVIVRIHRFDGVLPTALAHQIAGIIGDFDTEIWPQPMAVNAAWLSGTSSEAWGQSHHLAAQDFTHDPEWIAWWKSIDDEDDVFAAIYIEDRQKSMHRVTRSRNGPSISLGVPVRDALAAPDLQAFFRELQYNLWHEAAMKLGWPPPPQRVPSPTQQ
jgi:hypothetical protein